MNGNQRVLFYFLHNPWPPRSGAHHRCLQMVRGYVEAGFDVTFASSVLHSEVKWTESSIRALRKIGVRAVEIHVPQRSDRWLNRAERRFLRVRSFQPGLRTKLFCPISLRRWFRRIVERLEPEVLFINYLWFDQLVDHSQWNSITRIIETHDLISKNNKMRMRVKQMVDCFLAGLPAEQLFDESLRIDPSFEPDLEEFEIYDQFTRTVAISRDEETTLRKHLRKSDVRFVPAVMEPKYIDNDYSGGAMFTTGPNPFNMQGLLFLEHRIMPGIHRKGIDFQINVTGSVNKADNSQYKGMHFLGFVDDLRPVFARSSMFVCPVIAGTGQQLKIIEAMAHGLPVVAIGATEVGPLRHRENGMIARSAEEFAEFVLELHSDRSLCRRLGSAARETIRAEFDRNSTLASLI